MGQVPRPIGIIGAGRVSRHFQYYFSKLGVTSVIWTRASQKPLEQVVEPCELVLLLVSDDAIESIPKFHSVLKHKSLVHFSGCLNSSFARGAHPLMTFGAEFYDLESYRKIPFIVEDSVDWFKELFPFLPNPVFPLKAPDKALYHAFCVMAGNFTNLLWSRFFCTLEENFKIPRDAAFPFLERTLLNLESQGAAAATGPFVRKDLDTIRQNLEALKDHPFEGVYKTFKDLYRIGDSYEKRS